MSEHATEIVTPEFRMLLRPDGIVHLIWVPKTSITVAAARAAIDAMSSLTGGAPAPLLVETPDVGSQDRSARMEFVGRHDLVSAVALIARTPLSRMLGNFYISVSRPKVETHLFDDLPSAEAWLKEFTG